MYSSKIEIFNFLVTMKRKELYYSISVHICYFKNNYNKGKILFRKEICQEQK